jgi:hypothetical protein
MSWMAWHNIRKAQKATVHWRFAVDDARVKLNHFYPKFSS